MHKMEKNILIPTMGGMDCEDSRTCDNWPIRSMIRQQVLL